MAIAIVDFNCITHAVLYRSTTSVDDSGHIANDSNDFNRGVVARVNGGGGGGRGSEGWCLFLQVVDSGSKLTKAKTDASL